MDGHHAQLSTGGFRIESQERVEAGEYLELRIYAPDIDWPLMMRRPDDLVYFDFLEALVCWNFVEPWRAI
jgi:hypothetical protein